MPKISKTCYETFKTKDRASFVAAECNLEDKAHVYRAERSGLVDWIVQAFDRASGALIGNYAAR